MAPTSSLARFVAAAPPSTAIDLSGNTSEVSLCLPFADLQRILVDGFDPATSRLDGLVPGGPRTAKSPAGRRKEWVTAPDFSTLPPSWLGGARDGNRWQSSVYRAGERPRQRGVLATGAGSAIPSPHRGPMGKGRKPVTVTNFQGWGAASATGRNIGAPGPSGSPSSTQPTSSRLQTIKKTTV